MSIPYSVLNRAIDAYLREYSGVPVPTPEMQKKKVRAFLDALEWGGWSVSSDTDHLESSDA